tara:strand:- start:707 stop:1180 length:474 start_codon:yes stop_codon:yes gene_type:complete
MAWTESNEGRNVNNTETVALDGTTKAYTSWLKVPKGATAMVTIASAHTEDITVTIDIEGSYKQVPAEYTNKGGLNFGSLTHSSEEAVKDFVVFNEDEAGTDEAPAPVTTTIPPMGYEYIRISQVGSGSSTANVVYDVWWNLPVQNTLTTSGVGSDPS